MQWSAEWVQGLDVALNESDVCGVRYDDGAAECRLLLEVLALPETGPIDSDPRRVLVLYGVGSFEVLLRPDGVVSGADRPAVPLEDVDAVDTIFRTLSFGHSMYGWKFIDSPSARDDWPAEPSLRLSDPRAAPTHSIVWFTECGRDEHGETVAYCLEGVVEFEGLRVERADGGVLTIDEFAADARRWWDAFYTGDERLSVDAQRTARDPSRSWRPTGWFSENVMVPLSEDDA